MAVMFGAFVSRPRIQRSNPLAKYGEMHEGVAALFSHAPRFIALQRQTLDIGFKSQDVFAGAREFAPIFFPRGGRFAEQRRHAGRMGMRLVLKCV
jgi:hypothetical protein